MIRSAQQASVDVQRAQTMKTSLPLLVMLLAATSGFSQKLSEEEQQIVSIVEACNDDSISYLEQVVNINSGTLNLQGVRKVGEIFAKSFKEIGFETRWITMPDSMNRAGHLFAEHKGSQGEKLLLIGHLDTVFEKDSPFQKFVRRDDGTAEAPGGSDMKGGNVVILFALKALQQAGVLAETQIIVALHGDEEKPGNPISKSRSDLIAAAKKSDIALGFEPSSGLEYATIARRGSSGWRLEVKGKQAHSSGIFSEDTGAGAVFEASRILHQFYTRLKGEELLTFNPGLIAGGTNLEYDKNTATAKVFGKSNVVASTLIVEGGLRFITEKQKETARENMREIVSAHLPKTTASISFTDSYPAMPPTDGNRALLKQLNQISLDLGQGEVKAFDPGKRGAADISFIAEHVDGLDGLGTMGGGAHSPQEFVNLKTMNDLIKRTALLLYRLSR